MAPPRSPTHHHIVLLQTQYYPVPDISLPAPYTWTTAVHEHISSAAELHAAIHDATILVLATTRLDAAALSPDVTPHLRFINCVASGTDSIDLDACRRRGIVVSNCSGANVEAVSEHALGLYFAARRRTLEMHRRTRAGEWTARGTLMFQMLDREGAAPLTCREEVVGIVGYGGIGKRIAHLAQSLGMQVLISARKGAQQTDDEQRTPFDEVIRRSTVLFLALPRTPATVNLISTPELRSMSRLAVLVNVSRGGIVDEAALVTALQEGWIAGAATDVFAREPAGPDTSPLLGEETRDLNLTVSPHMAWLAEKTWANLRVMAKENVEGWCAGRPSRVVT
ncbi:hypothetical protein VTN02DRAFT_6590 [Thermoascus thermophilus]